MVHEGSIRQIKIVSRIHRRYVSKPDRWQEEQSREILEHRVDLADGLDLIPLVRDEVSPPYGHRHLVRALTGTAAGRNHFALWTLPVDEENIDERL